MSAGQFSVCHLLCSLHRVGSGLQPQLRSLGSSAPAAVAVTAGPGPAQSPVGSLLNQPVLGTNSSGHCPLWLFWGHGTLETSSFPLLSMADLCPNTQVLSPNCPNLFYLLHLAKNIMSWLSCLLNSCIHASGLNFCPLSLSMSTCIQI